MSSDRASSKPEAFAFYLSCDLNLPVRVRIDRLLGRADGLDKSFHSSEDGQEELRLPALYVEGQLCAFGEQLCLSSKTPFANVTSGGSGFSWSAWLIFPVKYRDLAHDTQLALTIWRRMDGEGLRPLGGTTLPLFSKRGRLKTGHQALRVSSGRCADTAWPSSTPAKLPVAERGELGRLEQLIKRYAWGEVAPLDWLDHLTFARIATLKAQAASKEEGTELALEVDLPTFPHAVLFHETEGPATTLASPSTPSPSQQPDPLALTFIDDPEVGRENPAELKAQKLARRADRGLEDRLLKPNTAEREAIEAAIRAPPNRPLSTEERGLLWRFRWSLTSDSRALTKVLKCVDWGDTREAAAASDLMVRWSRIEVAHALELLSPNFSNPEVRAHAVEVLKRTDDEELSGLLLQLVQALRYEPSADSRLAQLLVNRAAKNQQLAIFLHWYLYVEWDDPTFGARAAAVHNALQERLRAEGAEDTLNAISAQMALVAQLRHISQSLKGNAARKAEKLREMVSEGGECSELDHIRCPNPLDPSVQLAGLIPAECGVFKSALSPLRLTFRTIVEGQEALTRRESLAVNQQQQLGGQPAPPTPLGPAPRGRYQAIYKRGDDLRQDQLVVGVFSLMDRLLKRENLDLRLTPYRVLPTSPEDGLIECARGQGLATILQEHRTIHRYLALHNPDPTGPFGIRAECLDNFVKSCAGYCVMTYILGVGDRHNDNLMIQPNGRFFHIDFGYIMGRDPKPWPPPFKLGREMVDAMGGADSEYYRQFRRYACEAYNILRKSADLILSLLHLMAGAAIPDVRSAPEKALLKLQEKLRLAESDEVAIEWMQQLINESSSQVMAGIMETTHRWAQALR